MSLRKAKYCGGFALFQQTKKGDCMYLAFANHKISSKKGKEFSGS